MVLEREGTLLKKMKIRELEPTLQDEVLELAKEMDYERTVKASSNLHFLYVLYKSEKKKRRKSREALKKAESLIMTIATLQHTERAIVSDGKGKRKKRRMKGSTTDAQIVVSPKLLKAFKSIGIRDKAVVVRTVELLGDVEAKERITEILDKLGSKAAKKTYGTNPKLLQESSRMRFTESLDKFAARQGTIKRIKVLEGGKGKEEAEQPAGEKREGVFRGLINRLTGPFRRSADVEKKEEAEVLELEVKRPPVRERVEPEEVTAEPVETIVETQVEEGKTHREPKARALGDGVIALFNSIGITEERKMRRILILTDKDTIKLRLEYAVEAIGAELATAILGRRSRLLYQEEKDFVDALDTMGKKKALIDITEANEGPVPEEYDYRQNPDVLFKSFKAIIDALNIKRMDVVTEGKEEGPKYRGKPMEPGDFISVIEVLGFSMTREAKHGIMFTNEEGVVMGVQRAHRKQMMLNPSTIKKKLQEAGVDLDEFERARRGLGL
jgi:hypothetical protein